MSIDNLDRVFHPHSIAVVGADRIKGSIGNTVMNNLMRGGYRGGIFPITPDHNTINRLPTYPHLNALPEHPDLVVVATPPEQIPGIVKTCRALSLGGIVLIGKADKITEPRFDEIKKEIQEAARKSDVRIIGPNCPGIFSSAARLNAGCLNQIPLPGKTAFISQNNGINTAMLDLFAKERIGLSYFVSLGAMVDVNFSDMLDYLGADPQVNNIVLYMERLTQHRSFMSAARAVSLVKPIIALKAGRALCDAAPSASFTRAMISQEAVYDAAYKRAGIICVKTFEELFDCAKLSANHALIKRPGLAVITNSNGLGVMSMDALNHHGAKPVRFSEKTLERLKAVSPVNRSQTSPIVILEDNFEKLFIKIIQICRQAKEIDALLIVLAPDVFNDPIAKTKSLVAILKDKSISAYTVWLGDATVEKSRELFNRAGIPTFDSPERAVRAYMNFFHHSRNIETLQELPSRLPETLKINRDHANVLIRRYLDDNKFLLSNADAESLLHAYGIPVIGTVSTEEAIARKNPFSKGFELILGAKKSPDFGPVIYVGEGGIFSESQNNLAIGLPPLNHLLARQIIEETTIGKRLQGFRKIPAANLALLEDILVRLAQLVIDFPQIEAIDINPLFVSENHIVGVYAGVLLNSSRQRSPDHLVISSYPIDQERYRIIKNVGKTLIRPVRPEDAPLLVDLFSTLSYRSIHNRFFFPIGQLTPSMIARFTQIDYDREIALVAVLKTDTGEKMLGIARIIKEDKSDSAEYAITIGDPWHGKGVGAILLKQCLAIAKQRNIRKVGGRILATNTQMLALGQKLGFRIKEETNGISMLGMDLENLTDKDLE